MLFLHLCRNLSVDVGARDISACHRLKRRGAGPPPIIVRFVSRKARSAVLRARNKLREQNRNRTDRNLIYINEHLTTTASELFAAARGLLKMKRIQQTWTFTGRVYVKALNGNIKLIGTKNDLDEF